MELFWFCTIAVLWVGYFVLEGFDFGVGMLLPVLDGDPAESPDRRRVMLTTIGPHWDGNEVWLITAGGAIFAAFPHWYATLFSGFYIPLLLVLVALIMRGVALEYRPKRSDEAWRRWCDAGIMIGSWVPAFVWGVAFTNIVVGVPIDADMEYVGGLLGLFNPLALLGGIAMAVLCLFHGALFLALKTGGALHHAARRAARRLGIPAVGLVAVWLLTVLSQRSSTMAWVLFAIAAVALVLSVLLAGGRERPAFLASCVAIAMGVASLFAALFPDVMPSTLDPAWSLTHLNAASSPLTLKIMTGAAVVITPVVLLYTGYTYWVFRRRISVEDLAEAHG